MSWYARWRRFWYMRQKPRIWAFTGSRDEAESVRIAIRSGRINRLAIFAGNRVTSNTLDKAETAFAVGYAHQYGIPIILCRFIWETQPGPNTELTVLEDWEYYADQITLLQDEAKSIGARYTMFDTEAYGPTPITGLMRAPQAEHTGIRFNAIAAVVNTATRMNGQVDFVLPCGSLTRTWHPYLALAGLGKQRIAEGTYHDRPNINNALAFDDNPYTFDITGMYTGPTKGENPDMPLFTAAEVFGGDAYLWRRKEGLFIWPLESHAQAVAETLWPARATAEVGR